MHFGDFNPLEVLANAAVQRGVDSSAVVTSGDNSDVAASQKSDASGSDGTSDETEPAPTTSVQEDSKGDLQPLTVLTTSPASAAKGASAMPYVVKMVASGGNKASSSPAALKDATKIVIPNKDGSSKTLTVLKINKGAQPGQTLQYVIDRNKDEDEGYCSRSSLDSPGQCTRSDSELCDREPDARSPAGCKTQASPVFSPGPKAMSQNMKSPANVSSPIVIAGEQAKKPAKIVIVSRDSGNANRAATKPDSVKDSEKSTSLSSPNTTVLRTLLGGKACGTQSDSNIVLNTDKGSTPVKSCDGSQFSGSDAQGTFSQFPEQSKTPHVTFREPSNVSHISQSKDKTNIPKHDEVNNESKDNVCDTESALPDNSGRDKISDESVNSNQELIDTNAVLVTENSITQPAKSDGVTGTQQTEDKSAGNDMKIMAASDESTNTVTKVSPSENRTEAAEGQCSEADAESGKNYARERSESFQNAYRTFLTSGKPVEIIKSNALTAIKSDRGSTVISSSLLSALKSQGHITVIGENSAILNKTAAATINQVLNRGNAFSLKEEEEIIDVTSVDETSLPVKETLVHAKTTAANCVTALPTQQAAVVQVANSQSVQQSTANGRANSIAKTIPVLINTCNGKRLANVPVTSLLSASPSQTQKPMTYLVMPPQSKGTSLLLPQQVAKPQVVGVPKYQYIIQDDVPPVLKPNHTTVIQDDGKQVAQKNNDAWTLLATVNPQNTSSKSKTVPLLIKSPVISPAIGSTAALLQNSVVLSSRGPQSLIPKFVTSAAGTSHASSALHQNLVLGSSRQAVPIISNDTSSKLVKSGDTLLRQDSLFSSQNSVDKIGEDSNSNSLLVDFGKNSNLGEKIVLSSIGSVSGGRKTPITGRITPLHSLETSPTENTINIKITGSKMTRTSDEARPRKASTNIGKFGALSASWSDFPKRETPINGTRSQMSSPVVFGSATASPTSSLEPWSPMSLHMKSDSELDTTTETVLPYTSTSSRQSQAKRKGRLSSASGVDISAIKSGLANVGRLHPLIDHDYGSFKEFNAEIQSSIIATTESKQKIEKYNQKAKAQRSKESLFKLDKNFKQYKKRKYTHRSSLDNIRKMRQDKLAERPGVAQKKTVDGLSFLNLEQKSKPASAKGLRAARRQSQSALERRTPVKMRTVPRRDGKNYVKITGSYQDDFVYYATKHSRGRARKYNEEATREALPPPKAVKKPAVGGVNVFDWYRDLSKTDKSSRFGVPESPSAAAPLNTGYEVSVDNNHLKVPAPKGGRTPEHESEVADLVMAMLRNEEFSTQRPIPAPASNLAQPEDAGPLDTSETIVTNEVNNESSSINEVSIAEVGNQQEEIDQVLSRLLNSMGESELNMITEKLKNDMPFSQAEGVCCASESSDTDVKPDKESFAQQNKEENMNDVKSDGCPETPRNQVSPPVEIKIEAPQDESTSDVPTNCAEAQSQDTPAFVESSDLSALLGPYNQGPNLSQTSASFDLDDINDDLLQSDIGNMNALIGDLARSSSSAVCSAVDSKFSAPSLGIDSPVKPSVPSLDFQFENGVVKSEVTDTSENYAQNSTATAEVNTKLEQNELFPEVSRVVATPSPVQRPPDMIVVSMFWNDLPGLMIEGKRCVRLVDIHKQMLPAKDTGILKKRCQMMGLEIMNCSEMERDFLVRYANAAKSKSCVVVAKEDAEALVNFYVNPRPRTNPRQSSSGSRESSAERSDSRHTQPSGASTPSTESEFDYDVPRYTGGGKGKGKGKARPSSAAMNCDRASTPSGGGKAKRKQSPLAATPPPPSHIPVSHEGAVTQNTPPSVNTHPGSQEVSPSDPNIKRSNRTRNKKINYAAMNAGLVYPVGDEDESEVPLEGVFDAAFDEETRSAHENMDTPPVNKPPLPVKTGKANRQKPNGVNGRSIAKSLDSEKYSFVEELEIRRLRNKQKRKGLNNAEVRKLKRLKDRLTLKVKKFKKKLDRLKKTNGSQVLTNKNFLVKKALSDVSDSACESSPVKSILLPGLKKSLEEKAIEKFNNTVPLTHAVVNALPSEPVVVKTKQDTKDVELIVASLEAKPVVKEATEPAKVIKDQVSAIKEEPKHNTRSETKAGVKTEASPPHATRRMGERRPSEASPQRPRTVAQYEKSSVSPQRPRRVSEREVRPSELSPTRPRRVSERDRRPSATPKPPSKRHVYLPVLHRSSQRGRTQAGTLNVHLFRSRESACVQCETCAEFLSVRKFLKHLHHQNSVDELCMVTLPQKLELALGEPQPELLKSWQQFELKREQVERSFQQNKTSVARPKAAGVPLKAARRVRQSGHDQRAKVRKPVKLNTAAAPSVLVRDSSVVLTPLAGPVVTKASPPPVSPREETSPGLTRYSSRVRKRKQLHPMESYVYSYSSPPPDSGLKRRRLSSDRVDKVDSQSEGKSKLLASGPVTPESKRGVYQNAGITKSSPTWDTPLVKPNIIESKSTMEHVVTSAVQEIER